MMLASLLSNPITFLFFAISLIIAITVHEFSHAYMADQLGDPTPRLQGRLTLNPLAHLDPIGTIMLFLVRFGWGKPVQFDPFNLQNPRRDAALISIAGPASNITIAVISSVLLRILTTYGLSLFSTGGEYLLLFLQELIILNIVLAVFNFIPIHPLDGFKIVLGFLPPAKADEWMQLQRYGMIFLLFLIFPLFGSTPPLFFIMNPILKFFFTLLLPQAPLI